MRQIKEEDIPKDHPLAAYLEIKDRTKRNWRFFEQDGEIYIEENMFEDSEFLHPWFKESDCEEFIEALKKTLTIGIPDVPDIICQCGNDKFTLTYGDYELFATCKDCKKKCSVYSG